MLSGLPLSSGMLRKQYACAPQAERALARVRVSVRWTTFPVPHGWCAPGTLKWSTVERPGTFSRVTTVPSGSVTCTGGSLATLNAGNGVSE